MTVAFALHVLGALRCHDNGGFGSNRHETHANRLSTLSFTGACCGVGLEPSINIRRRQSSRGTASATGQAG
jgi:hypothetical protein